MKEKSLRERVPSDSGSVGIMRNPKDKLKAELLKICGSSNLDTIEAAINKHAEYLLNQGLPFDEILNQILYTIQGPSASPQVALPEGKLSPGNGNDRVESQQRSYEDDTKLSQVSLSPEKRSIPVKPKEKVFDEWAAVLRHQDEVNKETDTREKLAYKERQKLYRLELEQQRKELEASAKNNEESLTSVDKEAIELHRDFIKKAAEMEKMKEAEKKAQAAKIMEENLHERRRVEQHKKEEELRENQFIKEKIITLQDEDTRKIAEEKNAKAKIINALKESYAVQEELKKQQHDRERELDKLFKLKEIEKIEENEKSRQRYFEILKEKQRLTTEKEKLYANFPHHKREEFLKIDEANHLKYINDSLKKEEEENQRAYVMKTRDQMSTKIALSRQMEYKQIVKANAKNEDKDYAERVKMKSMEAEKQELKMFEEQKRKQQEYRIMLKNQIEDTNKRKMFKDVMSEHERRVNEHEIEAYENMDTSLHAKIVGVKEPSGVMVTRSPQKYGLKRGHDGSLNPSTSGSGRGISGPSIYGVPGPAPMANQIPPSMQLVYKLNAIDAYKPKDQSSLSKEKERPLIKPPSRLAEIAAKNMDDPNLQIMRHNTFNKGYGYKPAVNYLHPIQPQFSSGIGKSDLKNISLDAKTIEPTEKYQRNQNAALNKSFESVTEQKHLSGAGRELIQKNGIAHATLPGDKDAGLNSNFSLDAKRGSSYEPLERKAERPEHPPVEIRKVRPAGVYRRQAINYNIITGNSPLD